MLLAQVQSLNSVLEHEFIFELVAALGSFSSRVFSPQSDDK
jgi:hypothetical protein